MCIKLFKITKYNIAKVDELQEACTKTKTDNTSISENLNNNSSEKANIKDKNESV